MTVEIRGGDCRELLKALPDGSVHCVVSSPPYWGLRDYGTATWEGGDADCDHSTETKHQAQGATSLRAGRANVESQRNDNIRLNCKRCGARRVDSQIGMEPTPEEYVAEMVAIFREVRRVLRDDGTVWLNLGDMYAAGKSGRDDQDQDSLDRRAARYGTGRPKAEGQGNNGIQRRPPAGYKPKDLIGLPWMVAFGLRADGWWLRQDNIWAKRNCLSGGCWLYAKTAQSVGPMMLKDLVRLAPSTVQLWNGSSWTRVVSWSRNARPDHPIELVLRSGERIGCTTDHVWPTQRGDTSASSLQVGDKLIHVVLPQTSTEPPWLIADAFWFAGLYLAEGHIAKDTGAIIITGHIKEADRIARLRVIVDHYGGSISVHDTTGNTQVAVIFSPALRSVLQTLIAGDTSSDKRLTAGAWACSTEGLRAIADGYLHGDGAIDGSRIRLGFCRNYSLERDIRCLASRLGATLTLKPSVSRNETGDFPAFRGEWRWPASNFKSKKDRGEIVAIRRSRARKFWDVTVDGDPHLFALASGILTHNCMPESTRTRTTRAHEYVFHLTKSGSPTFWTHRDLPGTRARPAPDHRWIDATDKSEQAAEPAPGWLDAMLPGGKKKRWRRVNLWEGQDYFYDAVAIEEDGVIAAGTRAAKGSDVRSQIKEVNGRPPEYFEYTGKRNKRSVWWIATQPFAEAHFATMPPDLAETCIMAGTSEAGCCAGCGAPWTRATAERARAEGRVSGNLERTPGTDRIAGASHVGRGFPWEASVAVTTGWRPTCSCPPDDPVPCTVLDPFGGAGTTGLVADRLGRSAILIELNPEYCAIAERRLTGDSPLFAEVLSS